MRLAAIFEITGHAVGCQLTSIPHYFVHDSMLPISANHLISTTNETRVNNTQYQCLLVYQLVH